MTILSSGTAATPAAPALLDVYARVGPLLVGGEGAELIAADGARYLDFVAGIGVNALGYNHPVIRAALERAATTGIIHVSNLYRTEPGERLARDERRRAGVQAVRRTFVGPEQRERFAGSFADRVLPRADDAP